jgi:hypothetical protein
MLAPTARRQVLRQSPPSSHHPEQAPPRRLGQRVLLSSQGRAPFHDIDPAALPVPFSASKQRTLPSCYASSLAVSGGAQMGPPLMPGPTSLAFSFLPLSAQFSLLSSSWHRLPTGDAAAAAGRLAQPPYPRPPPPNPEPTNDQRVRPAACPAPHLLCSASPPVLVLAPLYRAAAAPPCSLVGTALVLCLTRPP